jgi:uncharacterized membrane-anchored protein YitT (DUF2179 family)
MHRPRLQKIWRELRRFFNLTIGSLLAAFSYVIFQIPDNIAAGGVSGIGIIVNHFTGFPVSFFYLAANVPLLILGFFFLGRWRFLFSTILSVAIFSAATEWFVRYLPIVLDRYPLTEDTLLNAIYAGIVGGIGGGLIYAAGATMGGTSIIGRIFQIRTGIPLSQIYLYVDGAIVATAALVFGWDIALYAMLTLLLTGLASDYVLEGPSRARTAIIVTSRPDAMIKALMDELERGASYWDARGGYTGETRSVVMCTIYRPQVNDLKRVVAEIDPQAFVSIGTTQQVLGLGFSRLNG